MNDRKRSRLRERPLPPARGPVLRPLTGLPRLRDRLFHRPGSLPPGAVRLRATLGERAAGAR